MMNKLQPFDPSQAAGVWEIRFGWWKHYLLSGELTIDKGKLLFIPLVVVVSVWLFLTREK